MEFIGCLSNSSKIKAYKDFTEMNRLDNYHFMPKHVLDLQLTVKDPLLSLGFIMRENWGVWNPPAGEWLVQKYRHKADDLIHDIVLIRDQHGDKIIYMTVKDNRCLGPVVITTYLATTNYLRHVCDGLDEPAYGFERTMYRTGGITPTRWYSTIEETQSNI